MSESPRCIALIADVIRSRNIAVAHRSEVQDSLQALLRKLNEKHEGELVSRFVITTGDEFQAVFSTAQPLGDVLWDLEHDVPVSLRVGLGLGVITTRIQNEAKGMDGPAWHCARAAIVEAKVGRRLGGVFMGFDDCDPVLNGLARLLRHFRDSLVPSQRLTLEKMRSTRSRSALVGDLAESRWAVYQRVRTVRWGVYTEGESALDATLARFDYTSEWARR